MWKRLYTMYKLAVWDRNGMQYLPVWGYSGGITHYARAREALEIFNRDVASSTED